MSLASLAAATVLTVVLSPFALRAQTPSSTTPAPEAVPVTSQTPVTPNGSTSTTDTVPKAATGAPMTKSERKAEKKQQKREEKSASDNAKAAKANAKAVKAQDKATDAAQQAQPH